MQERGLVAALTETPPQSARRFGLMLAVGSAVGLAMGLLGSKVLASIVYQASSRDPVVLGCVTIVMMGVGLLAAWIPARRALSVDPLSLLREE